MVYIVTFVFGPTALALLLAPDWRGLSFGLMWLLLAGLLAIFLLLPIARGTPRSVEVITYDTTSDTVHVVVRDPVTSREYNVRCVLRAPPWHVGQRVGVFMSPYVVVP